MSRLTAKQEKYVQGLVAGLSQREAYKQSYKTDRMKETTIDSRASELLKNSKVTVRYRELLKENSNIALWSRETSFNEYEWLKNKAKAQIQKDGVLKATSDAFLQSMERMDDLAFGELEKIDQDLKRQLLEARIEKLKSEAHLDSTQEDKLTDYLEMLGDRIDE